MQVREILQLAKAAHVDCSPKPTPRYTVKKHLQHISALGSAGSRLAGKAELHIGPKEVVFIVL